MQEYTQKAKVLGLLFLTMTLIVTLSLTTHSGQANAQQQNNTLMQPQGVQGMDNKHYEYHFSPWDLGRWIFMEQGNSHPTERRT